MHDLKSQFKETLLNTKTSTPIHILHCIGWNFKISIVVTVKGHLEARDKVNVENKSL